MILPNYQIQMTLALSPKIFPGCCSHLYHGLFVLLCTVKELQGEISSRSTTRMNAYYLGKPSLPASG